MKAEASLACIANQEPVCRSRTNLANTDEDILKRSRNGTVEHKRLCSPAKLCPPHRRDGGRLPCDPL